MNRRSFLRSSSAGLAGCLLHPAGFPFLSEFVASAAKPNVVLIMADDMGFSDIGCYGGEIDTPNLDRLAENGVRFTQFYNTGRCCPTRASLLTGVYPHQAGVGHMVEDRGLAGYRGFLNRRCVTIAEALKPCGYRTLAVGKWHVGTEKSGWPLQRGFDRFYGSPTAPGHYFRLNPGRKLVLDNDEIQPPSTWYVTDAFTEYAVRFIQETGTAARQPFFLYLAYTAPHWPLHALPAEIQKYRGRYACGWDEIRRQRYARMVKAGLIRSCWTLSERDAESISWTEEDQKDQMDLRMAVYSAQIEAMDRGIGKVLHFLKQSGLDRNTLVLFLSDNGGCAEVGRRGFDRGAPGAEIGSPDSYSSYGLSWANASNTPFRRFKHHTHEGGIAAPLIASWPGHIRGLGELEHQPGHVIDILPTILAACGAGYLPNPDLLSLEGKSLLPALQGKPIDRKVPLFWEHEGNRAIRDGDWKLVARYGQPWELYDLKADRTETKNLASVHQERARHLAARWQQWADSAGVVPWDKVRKADTITT